MAGAALLVGALAALAGAALAPSAALAAPPELITVEVPVAAQTAWVDIEQAGLTPDQLVLERDDAAAGWQPLPLVQTTFGLHAAFPVAPGTLSLRITSAPAATAGRDPDVAVTVLGSSDEVLTASSARYSVAPGGGQAEPAALPARSGTLSATGGPSTLPWVLGGAALLAAGLAALGWRLFSRRNGAGS